MSTSAPKHTHALMLTHMTFYHVADTMPDDNVEVLAWSREGEHFYLAAFCADRWYYTDDEEREINQTITHWAHLPKGPGGKP